MVKFLKYQTIKASCLTLQELIYNPSKNAKFYPYQTVGEKHYNLTGGYHRQFDVVAKAVKEKDPSILVECKYQEKPIGSTDVNILAKKIEDLKQEIPHLIPILYSVSGFTQPAKEKMKQLQISWSTPELWDVGVLEQKE
jgi:hypothetical protein